MILKELRIARDLLGVALKRYHLACSAFADIYDLEDSPSSISLELSDTISTELGFISSYELTLKEVRAVVCRTRNMIPAAVPISRLPPNVLTCIFEWVLDSQSCCLFNATNVDFNYTEILSQVCSRWHHIVTNLYAFWSHIDLVHQEKACLGPREGRLCGRRLRNRAKLFITRAAHTPLDVHIGATLHRGETDIDLNNLCASVAARTKSLELGPGAFQSGDIAVLRGCISSCTPGLLRQLVIARSSKGHDPHFIEATTPSNKVRNWSLDLPPQVIKSGLLPVRVLRLNDVYFGWESQVYHGLVELRLTHKCRLQPTPISQSQLVKIIAASPALRILHFGLQIVDSNWHPHNNPVVLRDLEVLNLIPMSPDQYGTLVEFIEPGLKPLQLLLALNSPKGSLPGTCFDDKLKAFIARSNITSLFVQSSVSGPSRQRLPTLLHSLPFPTLTALCLSSFSLFDWHFAHPNPEPRPASQEQQIQPYPCPRLQVLSLISCSIDLEDVRETIKILSIQELKMAETRFLKPDPKHGIACPLIVELDLSELVQGIRSKVSSAQQLRAEWDSWM